MSAANLLAWLNFFVADVRDGLGPFLGVFLLQNGFGEAQIGLIGTLSHIAALVFGVPCGILVDKTTRKKELIAFFITLIVLACVFNYFFPSFIFTLLAQIFAALSGVFLAPAFAALTLGIMGVQGYALQCARNEAYKHAGTVFGATLGFVFAFYFGIASIFFITAALGGVSLIVLSFIKKDAIDDTVARGEIHSTKAQSVSVWALFADKRVLVLCFTMFCFHLSNAAMLPLLSQRAHAMGVDSSGAYAAATIIIAQSTMILVAFVCGRLVSEKSPRNSRDKGALNAGKIYFWLFFACFFALIVRAFIAANFAGIGGMVLTQLLDGVGAGVSGVVVPIVVAMSLRGSGHINAALAFVLTCGGLGGALSGAVGGYFAEFYGYFSAYLFLGAVAVLGLVLWVLGSKFVLVKQSVI